MTLPTESDIDSLLFALHQQAMTAPYSGLPLWRSPEDREQLRVIVRQWVKGMSQESQR